ncbi:MAG: chromosomal replication initiator protein DnaA [Eubacteriaceae bacterium]|nr:chromosomal replication initiator protein DnaA [Eubacteriaceae bacterium]
MNQMYEIWKNADIYLKEELSPMIYSEYISGITPVVLNGDTLVLKVEAEYKKTCIQQRYNLLVDKAVRYANQGRNLDIKYIVADDDLTDLYMNQLDRAENTGIAHTRFLPKYTFDSFVVGSNNRLAHAAALAVAQSPGTKYNPLFIYGGVGLGKTHLMHAIGQFVLKEKPYANVAYVTSEQFTNDFIDAIRKETNIQFRKNYRNVDVLLVDDIQFLSGKEGTQEEFFHTFNELFNAQKQIVITSDKPPKDIPNLEQRLKTRFEWGLTCDISPPNYETRVAILKKKAIDENIDVSDEVIDYIAEYLGTNIRELEGALDKVKFIQELEGRKVGLDTVKSTLKDVIVVKEKHLSPELIIQAVSKHYGVSFADILSDKRTQNIALARQVGMYLTKEFTDLSLASIGDVFGGRNHSTVIHATNKVKSDAENDPKFNKELNSLKSILNDMD